MNDNRPLTSPEAEAGVIGALMINPELCEAVGAYLGREHFSDADLGAMYGLCLIAKSKEMSPDAVTLSELCPFLPSGADTLQNAARVQMSITSAANCEVYARIVIERHGARQMLAVAEQIAELARGRGSIASQIAQAQSLVMGLNMAEDSPDVTTLREALGDVVDDMDARFNGAQQLGLKFGMSDLDDIVRGLRPGNLAIIAGRPGTGKTVLGVGLAENIAIRQGGSALIFSLEMSKAELARRTLASVSSVSQTSIETGDAMKDGHSVSSITAAVGKMVDADIRLCDKPALTFSRICSIARFQHRAAPLDLIVIDYLGLISPEPGSRHQNRNQELGAISRGLKALAKELGIPVVALAQLNRGIETRGDSRPKMSDLRDSGEIEQDADVIIMAHRDMETDRGRDGITEMNVVKCRHAKPGFCVLQFQGDFARFVPCAQASYSDHEPAATPIRKSARSMIGGRQ